MISGGYARQAVFGGMKEDVLHPERIENALPQELIETLAGDDLDHASQSVKRGAGAVAPARSGLEVQRHDAQARNVVGQRLPRLPGNLRLLGGAGATARNQTGDMRQQVLDRDLAVRRNLI